MASANEEAPVLSVAVCTLDRASLLEDCLDSLAKQAAVPVPFEIVVVDNGPSEETRSVAMRQRGPRVRYFAEPSRGVNLARNRALNEARGTVLLLIDDDEITPPGYLARLARGLADYPWADGIGGPYRDYGGGPKTCSSCSLGSVDVPGEGFREVPHLLGGNMAIKLEVFEAVGPFDDTLSGRGDDSEWFGRARGHRFLFDPDLWVWHRRDQMGLAELCRHAFRQGLAAPKATALQGQTYRPRPRRIVAGLAHAVRKGCANGLRMSLRELGSLLAYLRR